MPGPPVHLADSACLRLSPAAIHWAASCGQLATLEWLVESGEDPESVGLTSQRAKRRRPLHWAARNGQLECVQYLVEVARVDPDPRDRQSVSPFQLAVWQNQSGVARYLVDEANVDVTQLNNFECGAQHWLGTAPRERSGALGEELLPLASWLKERGCDMHAPQRQGHLPLHKAAWGGQLALCQWLRDECGAVDDVQDKSGNYAADVAQMGGHDTLAAWLRAECSGARARSLATLGLPSDTTDHGAIRAAFMALARRLHPDHAQRASMLAADPANDVSADIADSRVGGAESADFASIRAAYEHLTTGGGVGHQSNPTHSLHRMLRATASGPAAAETEATTDVVEEAEACFRAQLAAVAHEYGSRGIPLPALRKKFAEVWGRPLPEPAALGLPPRTSLLRLVERFDDAVTLVPSDVEGGPPRLVASVSRETVLGHAHGAPPAAAPADEGDGEEGDGGNTRMAAARWPAPELERLPASLRPKPGQTLDLILGTHILLLQTRRGYRSNVDSMLLPYYASMRAASTSCFDGSGGAPRRVADLGCGNGLVGILAGKQWPNLVELALFERQESLAALAQRNLALNGLAQVPDDATAGGTDARATLHVGDLSEPLAYPLARFDGVLCNPPFYEGGSGGRSRPATSEKSDAHFESSLGIEGFIGAIADMLVLGGRGWLVYDTTESARLDAAIRAHSSRLELTNVTVKVHEAADDASSPSSRLLIELLRRDVGNGMAAEQEAASLLGLLGVAAEQQKGAPTPPHDTLVLHAESGCKSYSPPIEEWIERLPPCHYSIRSWDWVGARGAAGGEAHP